MTAMNATDPVLTALSARQPLPPVSRLVLRFSLTLVAWELRLRTRASLRRLDAHMLRDIGLDPWAAETEAQKPFWRA